MASFNDDSHEPTTFAKLNADGALDWNADIPVSALATEMIALDGSLYFGGNAPGSCLYLRHFVSFAVSAALLP